VLYRWDEIEVAESLLMKYTKFDTDVNGSKLDFEFLELK
jgi:hypothetical protein